MEYGSGYIAGGGIGFYSSFLNGSRIEIEGFFSGEDLDYTDLNRDASYWVGPPSGGIAIPSLILATNIEETGKIDVSTVMVNLLKDFPIGPNSRAFAGGGLGFATIDYEIGPQPTQGPKEA